MKVFGGKIIVTGEESYKQKVMLHLISDYLDKGHLLYADNFYNILVRACIKKEYLCVWHIMS